MESIAKIVINGEASGIVAIQIWATKINSAMVARRADSGSASGTKMVERLHGFVRLM